MYQIESSENGIVVTLTGELTIEDVHCINGVVHSDPHFEDQKFSIWDMRAATLKLNSIEEALEPASIDKAASTYVHRLNVALIATERNMRAICEYYIEHAATLIPKWNYRVFSSLESAKVWAQNTA